MEREVCMKSISDTKNRHESKGCRKKVMNAEADESDHQNIVQRCAGRSDEDKARQRHARGSVGRAKITWTQALSRATHLTPTEAILTRGGTLRFPLICRWVRQSRRALWSVLQKFRFMTIDDREKKTAQHILRADNDQRRPRHCRKDGADHRVPMAGPIAEQSQQDGKAEPCHRHTARQHGL